MRVNDLGIMPPFAMLSMLSVILSMVSVVSVVVTWDVLSIVVVGSSELLTGSRDVVGVLRGEGRRDS